MEKWKNPNYLVFVVSGVKNLRARNSKLNWMPQSHSHKGTSSHPTPTQVKMQKFLTALTGFGLIESAQKKKPLAQIKEKKE